MIYVTHDQVEAMTLADKIVVLDGGVVQQVGSPLDLYNTPANLFVAGFIGAPKMNLLAGTATAADAVTVDGFAGSLAIAGHGVSAGDAVTVGIRPHELVLDPAGIVKGSVRLVERLGNETIIRVALPNGVELTTALAGQVTVEPGEMLSLGARPEAVHVFNAAGKRI